VATCCERATAASGDALAPVAAAELEEAEPPVEAAVEDEAELEVEEAEEAAAAEVWAMASAVALRVPHCMLSVQVCCP
jgi:hypothetical protein